MSQRTIRDVLVAIGLPCSVKENARSVHGVEIVYNEFKLLLLLNATHQIGGAAIRVSIHESAFDVSVPNWMYHSEIGRVFRAFTQNPWAAMISLTGEPTSSIMLTPVSPIDQYISHKLSRTDDFYNLYVDILRWALTRGREERVLTIASKIAPDSNKLTTLHGSIVAASTLQR